MTSLTIRVLGNLLLLQLRRKYCEKPGSSGAIREAGGAFGKMQAAREDQFFYNKQKEQLKKIKHHLDTEIAFHEEQIKRHHDAIRRHREKKSDIDKPGQEETK